MLETLCWHCGVLNADWAGHSVAWRPGQTKGSPAYRQLSYCPTAGAGMPCISFVSRWCHFELVFFCNKIAEAEAAGSVNEEKWLVMHMHVQLKLDDSSKPRRFGAPQTLGSLSHDGVWPVAALLLGWILHVELVFCSLSCCCLGLGTI